MKRTMKIGAAAVLIAVLAALLLTGCKGEGIGKTADPKPKPAPGFAQQTEQPAVENAVEMSGRYAPDFLDAEQRQLYFDAQEAFEEFSLNCTGFGSTENAETIEQDGIMYYPANGKYTDWDTFETAMLALFTPEYFEQLNASASYTDGSGEEHIRHMFIEKEGKLYYLPGARGGDISYLGLKGFELLAKNDETIRFAVVGRYAVDPNNPGAAQTTESHTLELSETESGWRFSLYALPY